ncbi:hypothetical protein, partial [Roseovarius atlanticus]|uniref:hypothetical protein n=1 Tax=Roseovarius atlanticus TaxID=1641875 RepID=UPI001F18C250
MPTKIKDTFRYKNYASKALVFLDLPAPEHSLLDQDPRFKRLNMLLSPMLFFERHRFHSAAKAVAASRKFLQAQPVENMRQAKPVRRIDLSFILIDRAAQAVAGFHLKPNGRRSASTSPWARCA